MKKLETRVPCVNRTKRAVCQNVDSARQAPSDSERILPFLNRNVRALWAILNYVIVPALVGGRIDTKRNLRRRYVQG